MPAADAARAEATLDAYEDDRRRATPSPPPRLEYGRTWAAVVVAEMLLVFHLYAGPHRYGTTWSRLGSASAERILDGELWRTVTALTLHADAAHLLGNAVACVVFVGAVMRAVGPGLGGWLVLLAGAGGNALNAMFHRAGHTSIGSSTAIFGALGILGGLQFGRRRGERRAWLAVGATVALLAMLGTDVHTDVLAHLFGLVVGLVLGLAVAIWVSRPPGPVTQWALAAGALATVVACWLVAFRQ